MFSSLAHGGIALLNVDCGDDDKLEYAEKNIPA